MKVYKIVCKVVKGFEAIFYIEGETFKQVMNKFSDAIDGNTQGIDHDSIRSIKKVKGITLVK